MTALFLILIAVVILTSIWLNTVSSRIGVPALLAFMLLGILFANNGLWPVRFDNYDMAMVDPAFLQNDIFNIVFVVVLLSVTLQGSLIPWVAKKLDMVDPKADVLKTFNDYSEDTDMNFGRIPVTPDGNWAGKAIKDLGLPRNVLIVLVLRGGERIQPRGDTILKAGDRIVILDLK